MIVRPLPIGLEPLAAAAALAASPGRVVLHSGRDDDGLGAWSFVAAAPVATFAIRAGVATVRDRGGAVRPAEAGAAAEPLAALAGFLAAHGAALDDVGPAAVAGGPWPRVMGYLGYDLGRLIERLPPGPARGADLADAWLGAYDAVARWPDGGPGQLVAVDDAAADRLQAALAAGPIAPGRAPRLGALVADDDGAAHQARVRRILDYIAAGDVYQVNLARRLVAPIVADGDALALYAALAEVAPAPYGALIEADGARLISGSPERFLARAGRDARIETRPIKGTRPRTGRPTDDAARAADLAVHPKDAAEHLMIVDLERNDLGRVARTGSVAVDRLGYVVELPALYHLVSTVSAELRPDVDWAALLRATFPGGSITGAPKVRALEIIDELEPVRRGPYCGALGWFGGGGAFELAIAIRVATLVAGELRLHVGGGIVADSDPAAELAETEDKAAGWRATLAALAARAG